MALHLVGEPLDLAIDRLPTQVVSHHHRQVVSHYHTVERRVMSHYCRVAQ